jgi:hypothetical protein
MSTNGLPGKRVDAKRAGIMPAAEYGKSEESMNFGIDFINNHCEVFGFFRDVEVVYFHYKQLAMVVPRNPGFISVVEAFKIIKSNGIFIIPTSFLYLIDQCWYTCSEINEEIGWFNKLAH